MKALFLILLFAPSLAFSGVFDLGDHSGFIKDSAGSYYKVNASGTVSAVKTGTNLAVTEKINIPTSKGFFSVDLARSAAVEIPRIGKAVRTLAVVTGPVGLAVGTVQAICTLTSICNDAGQWMMQAPYDPVNYPDQTNSVESYCTAGFCNGTYDTRAGSANQSCKNAVEVKQLWGAGKTGAASSETVCVVTTTSNGSTINSSITKVPGCPPLYAISGTICVLTVSNDSTAPTATDWDNKESLLNDGQFIDELLNKFWPVPVAPPTIPNPVKVPIGSEAKTTKDGSGNTTGTETTTTEAEITTPTVADNPTGSPSMISIVENNVTNYYNTSNQLTSSVTTTTSNQSTVTPPQEPITISIDNVPDTTVTTYAVPGTFSFTSWGSGSCPADKTWNTMFGNQIFSYQLTCDFAAMFKPILLLIAAIVSFMIVASIRTE